MKSGNLKPSCQRVLFFNDTATTEIYTLSLHDALPICSLRVQTFGKLNSCRIPVRKTARTSLSAKRALTADSCSGFKTVSLPLDKFTSLKALSTTSTYTAAISTVCWFVKRAFQYVTHYGSANQEFADASVRRYEQKGVLRAGVPSPPPQSPSPFSLPPYPLPPTPFNTPFNIYSQDKVVCSSEKMRIAL